MDPLQSCLSFIVILILISIAVLAMTNRIIFKMAVRNFSRRKLQSLIVVCGLMIGTAIISSSLVVRDTMKNAFEESVYESLGEVDEEIWGVESWSTVTFYRYYNEEIYKSMAGNLSASDPEGFESIIPVIIDNAAVFDLTTQLGEPSAALIGFDSQTLRESSFGDLDGRGFYTDALNTGEVAINSYLADEMDASVGDTITISYGIKNPAHAFGTDLGQNNFTIVKIIDVDDLYGKANYNGRKSIFFELDVLQQMLNRPGEINSIWISNKGDYKGGDTFTNDVRGRIQEELDSAVGMNDLGLTLEIIDSNLTLTSVSGFYPLSRAGRLFEQINGSRATTMFNLMVPALAVDRYPSSQKFIMGVESSEPSFPIMPDDTIFILDWAHSAYGISNGTLVNITTYTLAGTVQTLSLTAYLLEPQFQAMIPPDIQAATIGVVNFDTSQNLLHEGAYAEKMVSGVLVSGLAGSEIENTRLEIIEQMDLDVTGADLNLEVHEIKTDNLESARAGGESLGTLFMIFGMFAIIAGVVLIINIFVMLGEERKSEMGMARAVGMKSGHLVRMYIFEGSLYAFVASLCGALLGLFFGWGIIQAFEFIFGSLEEFGGALTIPFYFTWGSVFVAFSLGLFITFITIIVASSRISKLNIIRAIRRIPEPRPERAKTRVMVYGSLLIVVGFVLVLMAFSTKDGGYYLAGVPSIILGLALIAHRWLSIQTVMSAVGIAILVFMFAPIPTPFASDWNFSGMTSFVFSGVFSVLGAVLLVMFNSNILLKGLQKVFGHGRSTRAILKTAISYPMDSKFKTGMTLGMFALIIFTVTVIAMIASMQAASGDNILVQQSGEYDVIGITNPRTPFDNLTRENLPQELRNSVDEIETLSLSIVTLVDYDQVETDVSAYGIPIGGEKLERYQLTGVEKSFLENNDFSLMDRDSRFDSDRECWEALAANSSYCIVDGTRLAYTGTVVSDPSVDFGGVFIGSTITITDQLGQNRTRDLTVIGIMDQNLFIHGIFIKKDIVKNEYGGADTMFLARLNPGADADAVAKDFERNYLELGLQTLDLEGIINTFLALSNNIMYLMEGFLGIGLLVGIAGIGIISYRNVVERRQQIGMLRAIGFKKSMVTRSFLLETSFITILAICIGLILGIGIGWQIYKDGFAEQGIDFTIPVLNLLAITVIAYIATLIFTIYPSIKASKIPPAEALRYIE